MPKETFFNLAKEKQDMILDVAIQEFSDHHFDQSSINRIVEKSGISKGSFYQYFKDKKDLYKYLFSLMGQEKMKYMSPALANPFNHSFLEVMHEMFRSGIQFAREHPKYMDIGIRLMQDKSHPLYKEIIGENESLAISVYKQLLEVGIKNGELDASMDTDFVAKLIYNMSLYITDYNTFGSIDAFEKNALESMDKLINTLAYGVKKKGAKHD